MGHNTSKSAGIGEESDSKRELCGLMVSSSSFLVVVNFPTLLTLFWQMMLQQDVM